MLLSCLTLLFGKVFLLFGGCIQLFETMTVSVLAHIFVCDILDTGNSKYAVCQWDEAT